MIVSGFTVFQPGPIAIRLRKILKFALLDNFVSDIFSKVEIWY